MNTAELILAAVTTGITLCGAPAVAAGDAALENDLLRVTFDGRGMRRIHDKKIDRAVELAGDHFSLTVNGTVIEDTALTPKVQQETEGAVTCTYQVEDYTVRIVYELKPGWRFVSKQLFLTASAGQPLFVETLKPFEGKLNHSAFEPRPFSDARYGMSLRIKDGPGAGAPTWGCVALVQNPYTRCEMRDATLSFAYEPRMHWDPANGPFASDRMCIGTYRLTGNTFRADMAPEWRYVRDPDRFLAGGERIDWAEIEAVADCARAFLMQDRDRSVRVHIGWCENDYQVDYATEAGREEYHRIVDQAAAMGCGYVLYTPSHSTLAPLAECRDAWKWESNLMLNLGQKFRKGEWVPGRDAVPADIRGILDYARAKNVKLMAYAYPSLPYMQNPEWTAWRTSQGKRPAGYLTVDTGLRSFQDWYVDNLVAFCEATGCAGFSFDHWWMAYKSDLGDVSSQYQQWYGCRRVLRNVRHRIPDAVIDGRQQYHWFGTWTWLSGTYPHPMMSDEQPGSFRAIVDLSTDRVNGARQRYIAWRLRTRDFCPVEILPGFITHQTQRSDAERVMRRDRYRTRDWDTLGWKYNLLSSVATAPFNHVINYIPARDVDEFNSFSEADKAFFRRWLDFTDENMDVLRRVRPIIGQPMIGRCDGTAAILDDHGYVFLFNPNYRRMTAEFALDPSIGLERGQGKTFIIEQLYPVEGLNMGKPGGACWSYGDTVAVPMHGTSARVLRIRPVDPAVRTPVLFGAPGRAARAGGTLSLSGVSGPVGETKLLTVLLGDEAEIGTLTVNGKARPFRQEGGRVDLEVTFAGRPFAQAQQVGAYDPDFKGRMFEGAFTIPKRIFDQLRRRREQWPVPYTEDDRVAPWIDNARLLLFVQIAEPYADKEIVTRQGDKDVTVTREGPYRKEEVHIEIDGKPVEVREGYNGVYPYVARSCMGMYADVSHLAPDVEHRVRVTLPEGLREGQFQGLFFEHVENEYTDHIEE